MTSEIVGILSQMQTQFMCEVGNLKDEVNAVTLEAAIKSVKDVDAVVNAYLDCTSANGVKS